MRILWFCMVFLWIRRWAIGDGETALPLPLVRFRSRLRPLAEFRLIDGGRVARPAPIAMEEKLRFAIREGGRTVGAGVVSKILE